MRPNIPRLSTKKYFVITLLLPLSFCTTVWADWARILDDPIEAGAARIDIIQQAQETIDVEYYAIKEGKAADLFFGLLFDTADRGAL
ncbi:hypothetical protein P4B35_01655 [Pontiellaceae bacterium B12227]|nr:hypothetical protein [Pontiellaceae bacterium B12227]